MEGKTTQRHCVGVALCLMFCMRICVCVCVRIILCVFVCASSVLTSKEWPSSHSYYCCKPLPLPHNALVVQEEKKGSGRESIVELGRQGREEERVRRSRRRGGGDVSLGRLLGAGRGAPIIVAGDRSETSPSNPSSSARKSCHRGSLAAPRVSHPVCQHPSWGTESRGPSRPKGQQDQSWGQGHLG